MTFVAVDENGTECCSNFGFRREPTTGRWVAFSSHAKYTPMKVFYNKRRVTSLPEGSIEKLIGYKLTWDDEPVELK